MTGKQREPQTPSTRTQRVRQETTWQDNSWHGGELRGERPPYDRLPTQPKATPQDALPLVQPEKL